MKKLFAVAVVFLILLTGCTGSKNISSGVPESSGENLKDMPYGELTPILEDFKKLDPVISLDDVKEDYFDQEFLAQKYCEIVNSSTIIKYLDIHAENSIIYSYLDPILYGNHGVTVSAKNFEYIDPFNAYFEFHVSNKNNNIVIPCFTKLWFGINDTNTKAERVEFIYGSLRVIDDELIVTTLKDIYVYDLETLEKKETDFDIKDIPNKNIYLSTVAKTNSGLICFGFDDGHLTTMLLDENFKIIDSEILTDYSITHTSFSGYENVVYFNSYFSPYVLNVYGDYVEFYENKIPAARPHYYYAFNAYEKYPDLKPTELIDDDITNATSFISNHLEESAYDGRYVLNDYAKRGAGDAWYFNLAVLDRETGTNTYLDTVGGMYGLGCSYGFFDNRDIYSMGYDKFKVFEKDKGYAEVLDLADSLNLDSYTKDGQDYFKSLIAVQRNPQTKEFVALYVDAPTDIFDRIDEFPVLSPNAVTDSQIQLPVMNVGLLVDALYESDTNYKIAFFDSNGKLTDSFEINTPVLVNRICLGDAIVNAIDSTHLQITFYMLENSPVRTGILDLTTRVFTETQSSTLT